MRRAPLRVLVLVGVMAWGLVPAPVAGDPPSGDGTSGAATLADLLSNARRRQADLDRTAADLDRRAAAGEDVQAERTRIADLRARNQRIIGDYERRVGADTGAAPQKTPLRIVPSGPRSPFSSMFGGGDPAAESYGPGATPGQGGMGDMMKAMIGDWRVFAISTALGLAGYFVGNSLGGFWGGLVGGAIGGLGGQWLGQWIVNNFLDKGKKGPADAPGPFPPLAGADPTQAVVGPTRRQGPVSSETLVEPTPVPGDIRTAYREMTERYQTFQTTAAAGSDASATAVSYQRYLEAKHRYDAMLGGAAGAR